MKGQKVRREKKRWLPVPAGNTEPCKAVITLFTAKDSIYHAVMSSRPKDCDLNLNQSEAELKMASTHIFYFVLLFECIPLGYYISALWKFTLSWHIICNIPFSDKLNENVFLWKIWSFCDTSHMSKLHPSVIDAQQQQKNKRWHLVVTHQDYLTF